MKQRFYTWRKRCWYRRQRFWDVLNGFTYRKRYEKYLTCPYE